MNYSEFIDKLLKEAFGSETINLATDPRFHNLIYGSPTPKEIKSFQSQLNIWKTDIYNPKIFKLYHGTSAEHNISDEGLKRTSNSRKKSFQSQPGFVYLSIFPNSAHQFGKMSYPNSKIVVYEVELPVYRLLPDKDQLRNQRLFADRDVKDDLAHSIIFGLGVRVKGDLQPYEVKIYNGKI